MDAVEGRSGLAMAIHRFPEQAELLRRLIVQDPTIRSICEEYPRAGGCGPSTRDLRVPLGHLRTRERVAGRPRHPECRIVTSGAGQRAVARLACADVPQVLTRLSGGDAHPPDAGQGRSLSHESPEPAPFSADREASG
jgi:hypothetical protein